MNILTAKNCKFRGLITGSVYLLSSVMSLTTTIVLLVVLGLSLFSGCRPSDPPPPPHVQDTSTPNFTPIPHPTSTPTSKLRPPVVLKEPEDGECLGCQAGVTLRWSCPYELEEGECYRLKVNGQSSSFRYLVEDHFTLRGLSPGEYTWAVTTVRAKDESKDEYVPVSEESESRHFTILSPTPPPPFVRSISPTSTVRGVSVPVVVSGDNFTHSLALTIGVPLHAAFVSSSDITATIPVTMEVGEYPVIVGSPTGEHASSVFFTVSEPPTPIPPPPTSTPSGAPVLLGPENGTCYGGSVVFSWRWYRSLSDEGSYGGEYFALRVWRHGEEKRSITWTKGTSYEEPLKSSHYVADPEVRYYWNVAVVRQTGEPRDEHWKYVSPESYPRWFCVHSTAPSPPTPTSPSGGGNGNKRPKPP